jgi:hypothetical protein
MKAMPLRPWQVGVVAMLLGAGLVAAVLAWRRPQPSAEAVRVVWLFEPGYAGAILSTPLVAEDAIFVAVIRDNAYRPPAVVYRLDPQTGQPRWEFA